MRHCYKLFIFTAALCVVSPSILRCDETSTALPKNTKAGKTVYDFEEVDILGQLKKPEGQVIVEPPEFRFKRLLDLDESFLPEIIRSADEF